MEEKQQNIYEGKHYIVRGNNSGVFFGEIEKKEGTEVTLRNCRRLWYWSGACSISQLAEEGVKNPESCKFTVTVHRVQISDYLEMDECTEKATKNIMEVPEWKC